MHNYSIEPYAIIASIWNNRALIITSTKREVIGRYRGSLFGLMWSFFNPLLMLAVYTLVFGEVFKTRWNVDSESTADFALALFSGLTVFNLFSECFNRAPSLILVNTNYVKKVIFPLEILPLVTLLSALYHFVVSISVWLIAYTILVGLPHTTILYLPLVVSPLIFFTLGISWVLAALGVFLRDLTQITAITINVLMFISPLFFPTSAFPEAYRNLLYLNPLTPVIEMTRDVMCWGKSPNPVLLGEYILIGITIAYIGFVWFQKTRKGFADVL